MIRRALWTTVAIILVTAWPGGAQPQSSFRPLEEHPKILFGPTRPRPAGHADPERLRQLARNHKPLGDWGGAVCPSIAQMRSLVDTYLATPHPAFPGLGSTTPGLSASWSSTDCGSFTYAAGLRNIEENKPLTPATLMGLASMTKPVIAALALMLNDSGAFGAGGLDTTVDQLLTPQQIAALTTGDDPTQPRCPGSALLLNRQTQVYEVSAFSCPDLSKVTLRHLMVSNHGMYDFLNEVGSPGFFSQYLEGVYFDVLQAVGIPATPPPNSNSGYDVLKAYGLKGNISAMIGGNLVTRDLEISFGNTGFQLLGVILEHQTGRSLDDLIRTLIVEPLRTDDIFVYVDPRRRRSQIADGYDVETGEPLIETTGVYPLVSVNGHTAVNTLNLGLARPGNINLAGGAGGLVANQKSYRRFLDAFVNGGLLGANAQAALDDSYIPLPDLSNPPVIATFNGFGLVKQTVRGLPGVRDLDIYSHNGSLPGVRCENAVIRRTDPGIAPVTGAFCQNANGLAFPSASILLLEFVDLITNANAGQP
jgi:CubicO group peptidase (beta-lactamase class C family)